MSKEGHNTRAVVPRSDRMATWVQTNLWKWIKHLLTTGQRTFCFHVQQEVTKSWHKVVLMFAFQGSWFNRHNLKCQNCSLLMDQALWRAFGWIQEFWGQGKGLCRTEGLEDWRSGKVEKWKSGKWRSVEVEKCMGWETLADWWGNSRAAHSRGSRPSTHLDEGSFLEI